MLQNLSSSLSSIVSKPREDATSPNPVDSAVGPFSSVVDTIAGSGDRTELSAFNGVIASRSGDELPLSAESLGDGSDIPTGNNLLLKLMANAAGQHQELTDEQLAQLQQSEPALALSDGDGSKTPLSLSLGSLNSDLVQDSDSLVTTGDAAVDAEHLIDVNDVVLNAAFSEFPVNGASFSPAKASKADSSSLELANSVVNEVSAIGEIDTAGLSKGLFDSTGDATLIKPVVLSFSVSDQADTNVDVPLKPLVDGIKLSDLATNESLLTGDTVELPQTKTQEADAALLSSALDPKEALQVTASNPELSGLSRANKSALEVDANAKTTVMLESSAEDGELTLKDSEVKTSVVKDSANVINQSLSVNEESNQRISSESKLTQTAVENLAIDASLDDGDSLSDRLNRPSLEQVQTVFQRAAVKPSAELQLVAQQDVLDRPMKMAEAANALSDKIHTMIRGELQRATIRLDPPELGALEVRVQVQNEQTQVQIISQSSQVREALEQQSARLREALGQQGLTMANLDVSDQSNQQTSNGDQSSGFAGADEDAELLENAEVMEVKTTVGLVDQYV